MIRRRGEVLLDAVHEAALVDDQLSVADDEVDGADEKSERVRDVLSSSRDDDEQRGAESEREAAGDYRDEVPLVDGERPRRREHLDALELTGGSSLLNGMYFFRGDVPMEEFIAAARQSPLDAAGQHEGCCRSQGDGRRSVPRRRFDHDGRLTGAQLGLDMFDVARTGDHHGRRKAEAG